MEDYIKTLHRVMQPPTRELLENLPKDSPDTKAAAKMLKKQFPALTSKALVDMLPSPRLGAHECDQIWTEADEAQLLAQWDVDPIKDYVKREIKPHSSTFQYLLELWKTCPRFMRCPPTDIISPVNHLAYDGGGITTAFIIELEGEHRAVNPLWSGAFCEALTHLVMQPMFTKSPKMLAMAIQYVVICRTNDCRPWPLENPTDSRFIDEFIDETRQNGAGGIYLDPGELHLRAVDRVGPELVLWNPVHHLFLEIEKLTKKSPDPLTLAQGPVKLYKVNSRDLNLLDKAATAVQSLTRPLIPGKMWYKIAQSLRGAQDVPNCNEELIKVLLRAELGRRRQAARARKQPPPAPQQAAPAPGIGPVSDPFIAPDVGAAPDVELGSVGGGYDFDSPFADSEVGDSQPSPLMRSRFPSPAAPASPSFQDDQISDHPVEPLGQLDSPVLGRDVPPPAFDFDAHLEGGAMGGRPEKFEQVDTGEDMGTSVYPNENTGTKRLTRRHKSQFVGLHRGGGRK